jgi:hypothetical protein
MVTVDEFDRPSEVAMDSINMWVRFYDLPKVMMKEQVARKLGELLGCVLRVDTSFPTYLRARVVFPLVKQLAPKIKMKIKGRGDMPVIVRYENVPHFCFGCGRIVNADRDCHDVVVDEDCLSFGVELRASPPKRAKQVLMHGVPPSAARVLNFVGDQRTRVLAGSKSGNVSRAVDIGSEGEVEVQGGGNQADMENQATDGNDAVNFDLAKGVEDLDVRGSKQKECVANSWRDLKEQVSFGTNLSSDKESLEEVIQGPTKTPNMLATERFLARKEGKGVLVPGWSPSPRKGIEKSMKRKATLKKAWELSVQEDGKWLDQEVGKADSVASMELVDEHQPLDFSLVAPIHKLKPLTASEAMRILS